MWYPELQGIVGGTYDRFIMGETAVSDPKSQLYLPEDVSINLPALRCMKYSSILDISHLTWNTLIVLPGPRFGLEAWTLGAFSNLYPTLLL